MVHAVGAAAEKVSTHLGGVSCVHLSAGGFGSSDPPSTLQVVVGVSSPSLTAGRLFPCQTNQHKMILGRVRVRSRQEQPSVLLR